MEHLCLRLAQIPHILCRLRLFSVRTEVLLTLYNAVLESIIRSGVASWYSSLTVQLKCRVDSMVQTTKKVVEKKEHPSPQTVYERTDDRHEHRILKDPLKHSIF